MMLALLAILTAPQQAPTGPPPAPPVADGESVTVTGRPIGVLRSAWRACIENGCPPQVEIARAMEYGEAQLVAGDYAGSWRTVRTTKRRTMPYADRLPLDVAQISRATARTASLNGEASIARFNSVEAADALRAGLASDDARIMLAQLDIGDGYVTENKYDFALAKYARVGKAARDRGHAAIAAEAAYRRVNLLVGLSHGIPMYMTSARRETAAMLDSRDLAVAPYRDLVRLTAVNMLPPGKRPAAVEAMLPTLKPRPANDLLLALAPPIDFDKLVFTRPPSGVTQQWLDIRYVIAADGTVSHAAVVRSDPSLDPALRKAAVTAAGRRRYTPLALQADNPGLVNYARYTFIFNTFRPTGSRLPDGTMGVPRVDSFDLGSSLARRDAS